MKIDYKLVDKPIKRRRPLRWVTASILLIGIPVVATLAIMPGTPTSNLLTKTETNVKDSTLITVDSRTLPATSERPAVNIKLVMPGAAQSRTNPVITTVSLPFKADKALTPSKQLEELSALNSNTTTIIPSKAAAVKPSSIAALTTPKKTTKPTIPWKRITVAKGDNLSKIFAHQDLSGRELYNLLALGKPTSTLKKIHPGDEIRLLTNDDNKLEALEYDIDAFNKLVVSRVDGKLKANIEVTEKEIRLSQSSGTIDDSLYLAAGRAGMSDNVIMQMVEIFGWDVDFALEIRKGDRFSVIHEEIYRDGEKIRDGRILATEFINRKNVHRAFYFDNNKISGGYYDPDGRPMRKAFLRTPVKFSRISSRFSKKRWHPKLKKWRSHKGTDYAARTGTPIRSTADGRISYRGWMRGYGKVVMIKHANSYKTVYGHMSRFSPKLKKGSLVKQGKIIGYVGQTGLATGPHLHYETRINGKHQDPERIKFPKADPLPKKYRSVFKAHAEPLTAQLDNLNRQKIALNH